MWLNLIFLMLVALLPFSSGLMSHLFVHPVSQLFYYGNQFAIASLLNIHWHYAKRKGLIHGCDPRDMFLLTLRIAQTAAVFAASLVAALFISTFSWVPIPMIFVGGLIIEWSRRRK